MFDKYVNQTVNQTNVTSITNFYNDNRKVYNDNRKVYIDNRKVIIVNQIQNTKITKLDRMILIAIANVIEETSSKQGGKHIAFALLAEVGTELKKMKVQIPSLKNYLETRSDIFRVGQHPKTKALTVSARKQSGAGGQIAADNRKLLR